MKPDYRTVNEKDREFNAIFFKVVFVRAEWSTFKILSINSLNTIYDSKINLNFWSIKKNQKFSFWIFGDNLWELDYLSNNLNIN